MMSTDKNESKSKQITFVMVLDLLVFLVFSLILTQSSDVLLFFHDSAYVFLIISLICLASGIMLISKRINLGGLLLTFIGKNLLIYSSIFLSFDLIIII